MEKKRELVFVPIPALGHIVSTVELAQRLLNTNPNQISITLLNIKSPIPNPQLDSYVSSLPSIFPSLKFLQLPHIDPPIPFKGTPIETFISLYINGYKPHIKAAITQAISTSPATRLAGLVIDLFSTTLIDVAADLGVPAFLFFTSNAALLDLMLHLPSLDAQDYFSTESNTELTIPSFSNSVPLNVLPSGVLNTRDEAYKWYVYHGRRYRETKGILVNTLVELEQSAMDSFVDGGMPRVYAVGPVIDVEGKAQFRASNRAEQGRIMKWLDEQPAQSVVLLCFGSGGGFTDPMQVRAIAMGLERSGRRFLWVLRGRGEAVAPREWLPEGFEGRVEGRGVVCEWVDQVEVLGHGAIGGFVSHCGWNSILESLWFGVPIATWPMYAEQQLNAFYTVREKGMAVEIRLDYRLGGGGVVTAEEVERGIRRVMEKESEVRRRVEEMSKRSREAARDGGSSFASMERFIEDLVNDNKVTSM